MFTGCVFGKGTQRVPPPFMRQARGEAIKLIRRSHSVCKWNMSLCAPIMCRAKRRFGKKLIAIEHFANTYIRYRTKVNEFPDVVMNKPFVD